LLLFSGQLQICYQIYLISQGFKESLDPQAYILENLF